MHLYWILLSLIFNIGICKHVKDKKKEKSQNIVLSRYRRQTTSPANLTIEVLFVVDYAVYTRFLFLANGNQTEAVTNIEIYYARVFDGLNRRYKGIVSPDVKFVLTYSDLNVSTTAESSVWTSPIKQNVTGSQRETVDTADALNKFLKWTNTSRDLPNFDYAILFSGYNLVYAGSASNKGLSYPSSICKPISLQEPVLGPVAVVEETYDTRVVGIAAQELGRSLGARRDLDGNFCLSTFLYIMTDIFQFPDKLQASNPWKFSSCSIDYFEKFISSINQSDNCLSSTNTETTNYIQDVPAFLSAQSAKVLNIDDQCRYVYGTESFLCRGLQTSDFGSICRGAQCYDPKREDCFKILPSDGTLCGNMSLCVEGVCRYVESAPEAPTDCPFGNQPTIPVFGECDNRIITNNRTYDCYEPGLRLVCCKTCADIFNGVGGCEYGDRLANCDFNSCVGVYDNYTRDVRCCRTCSVKPLSKSSIFTSTVTIPTVSDDLTSSITSTVPIVTSDSTVTTETSDDYSVMSTSDTTPTTETSNKIITTDVSTITDDLGVTTVTTYTTDSFLTTTDSSIRLSSTTTADTSQMTDMYSSSSSYTIQESTEESTIEKSRTTNLDTSSSTGYSSVDTSTTTVTDRPTTSADTTSKVTTSSQYLTTMVMSTTIPTTSEDPTCLSDSRWYSSWLSYLFSRFRWRQRLREYRLGQMRRHRWWRNSRFSSDGTEYLRKQDTGKNILPTYYRRNQDSLYGAVAKKLSVGLQQNRWRSLYSKNRWRNDRFSMRRWRGRNRLNRLKRKWNRGG